VVLENPRNLTVARFQEHRIKTLNQWGLALAALLLAANACAQVTVSGVKFDDATDVRGSKVQLNGAGVRYKAIFKVYAAGLYLPKKADTPEQALTMPGAKRITSRRCATSTRQNSASCSPAAWKTTWRRRPSPRSFPA
jgi:hypothetical protein